MLDVKDRKLLAELMLNSRTPISSLSKRVGVSREVCAYRLKRLENDFSLSYYTIINFSELGYKRFICFIQLKGASPDNEDSFIRFLKEHDFVTYLSPTIGKWNFVLDIIAKDDEHLKQVVIGIKKELGNFLETFIIHGISVESEIYPTKLVGITSNKSIPRSSKSSARVDSIDKKILSLLSNNSRIEYKDLSLKLGLSANTIKYRIKNLEKTGIIEGYSLSLNFSKIGEIYNIQFKFYDVDEARLFGYIRNHKNTLFYYKYFGNENWDLDVGFIGKDSGEFRRFLLEFKEVFGASLRVHDIYIINEITKDNVAPAGLFN